MEETEPQEAAAPHGGRHWSACGGRRLASGGTRELGRTANGYRRSERRQQLSAWAFSVVFVCFAGWADVTCSPSGGLLLIGPNDHLSKTIFPKNTNH